MCNNNCFDQWWIIILLLLFGNGCGDNRMDGCGCGGNSCGC